MLAIYVNAGNSKNDNPRRGWIIVTPDGDFGDFVEEGYEGRAALQSAYPNMTSTTSQVPVTPAYYNELVRQAKKARER